MTNWTSAAARALRFGMPLLAIFSVAGPLVGAAPAAAETLSGALAKAVHNIPDLLRQQAVPPGKDATRQARDAEQNVLQIAAQCYMDVLRDAAIYALDVDNVDIIDEQLQIARDRLPAGQTSNPDIVQIEARLLQGHSLQESARAILKASIANYRQVIGDKPDVLEPGKLPEMPATLDDALAAAQAAQLDGGTVAAGGAHPASASVRLGVETAWNTFAEARLQVDAAQAHVEAATAARNGTREEVEARRKTPVDALDVQQSLLKARVALIIGQHKRIVAAYALLAAAGRLSAETLGLAAPAQVTAHLEANPER